jgi:hypothetical protein
VNLLQPSTPRHLQFLKTPTQHATLHHVLRCRPIMYDTAGRSAHQHPQYTTRHGHQQITWKDSVLR